MEATQARFDHLEKELGKRNIVIAELEKQLAESEANLSAAEKIIDRYLKQLADFEHMSEYSNVIRHYQLRLEEAEKREAGLRAALEEIRVICNQARASGADLQWNIHEKARAALEE